MSFLPTLTIPKFETELSPWEELTINNFSPGLWTAFPESNIPDNAFTALTNYYIESDNSLKVRGPYRPYNVAAAKETVLTTAPLSFRFVELGTTNYSLAYRSGALEYWDGSAWQDIVEETALTGGTARFVKFSVNDKDDVLIFNGNTAPQRWIAAGGTSTDLGLDVPSVGSASGDDKTDDQTRGLATGGSYYYKFTYWYESSTSTKYGESNPSTAITVTITAPTAGQYRVVELTNLPAVSGDVARLYIYRSPVDNSSGPYRQVGFIASGTTFTDDTPEGEEDVELPIDDGSVPNLKNPVVFKGRVWGIGALKNKGVWSAEGTPDLFPALNYAYFPDELIGAFPFRENIYWFTTKQIYITPNADIDTYPKPLKICDKGCTSYQSIVDVGNGLVFQGEDNIYWVDFNTQAEDGDFPIPIGEPIKDKIQNIPSTYRDSSVAYLHKQKYYLSYTGQNQTVNTATLVWDVKAGIRLLTQGLAGGWSALDWAANDIQDFEGTLYTADNTNKYIMEHEFAGSADYISKTEYDASTSHNIATELTTKRFHFGHEWAEKLISSLSIATETSGITYDASLSLLNLSDTEYKRSATFTLGTDTLAIDNNWLVWGQGTWGNFNWGDTSYGHHSSHKKFQRGSKCKNAQLSLTSSNSQDTNLILLKLFWKPLLPPA